MWDLIQNRLLLRPDTVDGWGTTKKNTLGSRTRAKLCTTWRTPLGRPLWSRARVCVRPPMCRSGSRGTPRPRRPRGCRLGISAAKEGVPPGRLTAAGSAPGPTFCCGTRSLSQELVSQLLSLELAHPQGWDVFRRRSGVLFKVFSVTLLCCC